MIYFDVTDIVSFAATNSAVTGIQRGTLRIIGSAYEKGFDVSGMIKHPLTGKFMAADLSFLTGGYNFNRDDFLSRFEIDDPKALWLEKKLSKYAKRPRKRVIRKIVLEARFALSRKTREKVTSVLTKKNKSCLSELRLKNGDALATLGGWGVDYVSIHAMAVANCCKTVAFVHDIFPITFGLGDEKDFKSWLMFCCQNYDMILCNSEYTKSELESFLKSQGIVADIRVSLYPHEFVKPRQIETPPEYVLCVGTRAGHKNIPGLMKAWGEVRHTLGDCTPTLVIAGERTHEIRAYCTNMDGVTFLERPDDVALEQLYRGCLFTVFPSRCEGWGIPIGESLWFGKPVLCAKAASMPEVGMDYADYFDLNDPDSLHSMIVDMVRRPRTIPGNVRSHLRTWRDTATSVVTEIEGAHLAKEGDIVPDLRVIAAE